VHTVAYSFHIFKSRGLMLLFINNLLLLLITLYWPLILQCFDWRPDRGALPGPWPWLKSMPPSIIQKFLGFGRYKAWPEAKISSSSPWLAISNFLTFIPALPLTATSPTVSTSGFALCYKLRNIVCVRMIRHEPPLPICIRGSILSFSTSPLLNHHVLNIISIGD